jgi:hypothetical protein
MHGMNNIKIIDAMFSHWHMQWRCAMSTAGKRDCVYQRYRCNMGNVLSSCFVLQLL